MKKKKAWRRIAKRGKAGGFFIVRWPDFSRHRLIPVIVQEKGTERVLMLAWTREREFRETFFTHEVVFWSRSRKKRWKKGEEKSGNILLIHEIWLDCDGDTLLYIVKQSKPEAGVCHFGNQTCLSPIITSVFEQKGNTKLKVVPV